jgi:6-phosphogluconolactonase (cycloisomerase 2 family)
LVLQNNGGDNLKVSASGAFTFATALNAGKAYSVTVSAQPSNPAQSCVVTNGSGTANANVTNVSVACTTATGTVGGTVSGLAGTGLVLQNNGGDNLKVSANGTFTFAIGVASGGAYAVTVSAQPTAPNQVCSVKSGSGTVSGTNVSTVTVVCLTIGQFAYAANNVAGTISAYTINPSSGVLTSVGAPVPVGTAPAAVSLSPNGKFAYSAIASGTRIAGYTINPTTGALTPITGSPFTTPFVQGHPYPDIAVDPQSKFLYLASINDNNVAGFAIDSVTGVLTAVPGSPFPAGAGAGAIPAFSPNGKFLYVMNQNATPTGSVSGYAVDPNTGALAAIPGSPFAAGKTPTWISFSPNGKFAYVSNSGSGNVSGYAVDAAGALTPLPGSPFPADTYPADSTVDATGTHLYVPNRSANNISVFAIDAAGVLSVVGGGPVAAGPGPTLLLIEPSGKFAYVSSSTGNDVRGYTIDATTGALSPMPSPFAAGTYPLFINIDPSGKFAYTANNGSNNVSGYAINASTGALAPIAGSPFPAGTAPFVVSISPEAPGFRD